MRTDKDRELCTWIFTTQSLSITFQFNAPFDFLSFFFFSDPVNHPGGRKLNLLHHNRPQQLLATVILSLHDPLLLWSEQCFCQGFNVFCRSSGDGAWARTKGMIYDIREVFRLLLVLGFTPGKYYFSSFYSMLSTSPPRKKKGQKRTINFVFLLILRKSNKL